MHSELKNTPPPPPPRANQESPIVPYYNRIPFHSQKVVDLKPNFHYDFLNDAVHDFERTLERSKKPKTTERKSSLNRKVEINNFDRPKFPHHGEWIFFYSFISLTFDFYFCFDIESVTNTNLDNYSAGFRVKFK